MIRSSLRGCRFPHLGDEDLSLGNVAPGELIICEPQGYPSPLPPFWAKSSIERGYGEGRRQNTADKLLTRKIIQTKELRCFGRVRNAEKLEKAEECGNSKALWFLHPDSSVRRSGEIICKVAEDNYLNFRDNYRAESDPGDPPPMFMLTRHLETSQPLANLMMVE